MEWMAQEAGSATCYFAPQLEESHRINIIDTQAWQLETFCVRGAAFPLYYCGTGFRYTIQYRRGIEPQNLRPLWRLCGQSITMYRE